MEQLGLALAEADMATLLWELQKDISTGVRVADAVAGAAAKAGCSPDVASQLSAAVVGGARLSVLLSDWVPVRAAQCLEAGEDCGELCPALRQAHTYVVRAARHSGPA